MQNNTQGTSQITFFGTEDLGGGMKANFLMENDFDATLQATNNFSSKGGEVYAGLSGGFGAVQVGAPNTPSLDVSGRTPFGTKIGSGFSATMGYGVQGLGHVRENNSVVYTSPTFNGLTFKAANASNTRSFDYTNSNTKSSTSAEGKQDIGATYVNGGLKAVLAQYKQANNYKQTHGYVAYTMGNLTATYGFNRDERLKAQAGVAATDATTSAGKLDLATGKLNGQNVAVSYAMGKTTLMANVGKLNDKTATNYDLKVSTIGAKYDLSNRTSLYTRYVSLKGENMTWATTGNTLALKEQKTLAVGMQHNF